MKTTIIEATEFTDKATVLSLSSVPTIEQQNKLFSEDDSVILEF
jgi:hypothetical protein